MDVETNRLNALEARAWMSRWYHDRRARAYAFMVDLGHALGAVQIILSCIAFSAGWPASLGVAFSLGSSLSIVVVHYLRFDARAQLHRRLAVGFGEAADKAEFAEYDDPALVRALLKDLQQLQAEEGASTSQLEVLTAMARNAWLRRHDHHDGPGIFRLGWLQRRLAPFFDIGAEGLRPSGAKPPEDGAVGTKQIEG